MKVWTKVRGAGAVLAFGVVLLNTLPVWLAELAALGGLSDVASGVLASLILVSSAIGCFRGSLLSNRGVPRLCGVSVVLCFGLAAAVPSLPGWVVFILSLIVGASLGVVLSRGLAVLARATNPTTSIGVTISIGLVISLVILGASAVLQMSIIPIISGSAGIAMAVAWPFLEVGAQRKARFLIQFWQLLPFFVAMGVYWVFLELYAKSMGIATIVGWIAASLIVSAAGSALAGHIAQSRRNAVKSAALVLAALTGGLTYLGQSETFIGLMILANAFFLFLYIPFYLTAPAPEEPADRVTRRMAVYLLGFAFGGIAGTALLSVGGYGLVAVGIAATGLAAIARD